VTYINSFKLKGRVSRD